METDGSDRIYYRRYADGKLVEIRRSTRTCIAGAAPLPACWRADWPAARTVISESLAGPVGRRTARLRSVGDSDALRTRSRACLLVYSCPVLSLVGHSLRTRSRACLLVYSCPVLPVVGHSLWTRSRACLAVVVCSLRQSHTT